MTQADTFRRHFPYLILLCGLAPPVTGPGCVLYIEILTLQQLLDLLRTPS